MAKHTVTSEEGLLDQELKTGEYFNCTFTKPGIYEYYCKNFPSMTGKVIIQ